MGGQQRVIYRFVIEVCNSWDESPQEVLTQIEEMLRNENMDVRSCSLEAVIE